MVQQSAPAFELSDIFRVIGRWKMLMAAVVAASVCTAGYYALKVLPRLYEATATINASSAVSGGQAAQGTQTVSTGDLQGVVNAVTAIPRSTLQTDEWQLTSPAVLKVAAQVLAAAGVPVTPSALGGVVSAGTVPNTNLITVSASGRDPVMVAKIANVVAQAFITYQQQQAQDRLDQALTFLQQQATTVQQNMDQVAAQLATAQQNQPGVTAAQPDALTALTQQLATLQDRYTQARTDLEAAISGENVMKTQLSQIPPTVATTTSSQQQAPVIDPTGHGLGSPGVTQGQTSQVAPNPVYQTLSQQLALQEVQVAQQQTTVDELQAQIGPMQDRLSALQAPPGGAPAPTTALQSRLDDLRTTYQTLTSKITDTQIAQAVATSSVGVTLDAPATVPSVPYAPKKRLYLGMGLLVGLVAAIGLAFLLEQTDHTIKSSADIRRIAALPTLAVIPFARH